MNQDEKIAEAYLKNSNTNVVYEPDGNIPPDFSVNGNIGVEVRRLNQQYRENGHTKGLEEQGIRLKNAVEAEISPYPKDLNGNNYLLSLSYRRGIGKISNIRKNVKLAIGAFQAQSERIPFSYTLNDNVKIEFVTKASYLPRKYKIAIDSDEDSGGWVVNMYVQETTHCINEKEQKIKPYAANYSEWWLLLIDHIHCVDNHDKNDIVAAIKKPSAFERVIVIKHDGSDQFEI